MKKNLFLILALIASNSLFGQIEFLHKHWKEIPLDWEKLEVTFSEEEKLDFLRKNIKNFDEKRESPNTEPGSYEPKTFHILDIDGDFDLDIIQYRNSFLGEELTVLLNESGKIRYHFRKLGKILSIERLTNNSPLQIRMVGCVDSGYLTYFLNHLILINENNKLSIIKDSIIFYPSEESVYPTKQTINIPFKVTNEKYKLRQSPIIDDVETNQSNEYGNLIAEFTQGDIGYAYDSKVDEIGRVWWFVIMENNVKKDWTKFYHCDHKSDKYKNMKVCGWMSSRYLEKIK